MAAVEQQPEMDRWDQPNRSLSWRIFAGIGAGSVGLTVLGLGLENSFTFTIIRWVAAIFLTVVVYSYVASIKPSR